jgi:hypothetical protein
MRRKRTAWRSPETSTAGRRARRRWSRAEADWSVTVALPEGSWSYSFVVDGKFVEDPLADGYRADGFGGKNAVVRVGHPG